MVILLVNTFYHSGDCISGYCWIFVYVILNAYLGLNHTGCGFGVSVVCDMEEVTWRGLCSVWHWPVASFWSADHAHGLLSTLQTNMQTLNRFLHLPQTNAAAVWKHTAAVCHPWEREVQDSFSFDFSGHLRQAALNYIYAVIISNLPCPEMLRAFVEKSTAFAHFRGCSVSNL